MNDTQSPYPASNIPITVANNQRFFLVMAHFLRGGGLRKARATKMGKGRREIPGSGRGV